MERPKTWKGNKRILKLLPFKKKTLFLYLLKNFPMICILNIFIFNFSSHHTLVILNKSKDPPMGRRVILCGTGLEWDSSMPTCLRCIPTVDDANDISRFLLSPLIMISHTIVEVIIIMKLWARSLDIGLQRIWNSNSSICGGTRNL